MKNTLGAIILAGGKGKRMKSLDRNKVTFNLGDRPIIARIVNLLKQLELEQIVVVSGFAKESVVEALKEENVTFAVQVDQLGTADAAKVGLSALNQKIKHVIMLYGDDASLYPLSLLKELVEKHALSNSALTFITFETDIPFGLGRITRDDNGKITSIVEEKNATDEQKKIKEVNPGCYIFSRVALEKYLPQIGKNELSGEFYLTDIISLLLKNGEKVETVNAGKMLWKGINTQEDLAEAEKLFLELK